MVGKSSDRLKKFEAELHDLEQWLNLGLVPKKDIDKHKTEIEAVKAKIDEEIKRAAQLKETGDLEEYVTPRKGQTRTQFTENPTMPDMETAEEPTALTDVTTENQSQGDTTAEMTEGATREESEEDDYFSDKARWKRGMLHSDDDEW